MLNVPFLTDFKKGGDFHVICIFLVCYSILLTIWQPIFVSLSLVYKERSLGGPILIALLLH